MQNIKNQGYHIGREDHFRLKGHPSFVVWFTGLSGSGKSTLANLVEKELFNKNIHTYSLDGDNIRGGINKDLDFTTEDREENLRRIAEVAKMFLNAGIVVIGAFISPLESDRKKIKNIIGRENFIEIFVDTSVEECEKRDVKGLYKKARAGEILNFTGINAPYEKPVNPDVIIKTEVTSLQKSIDKVMNVINSKLLLEQ